MLLISRTATSYTASPVLNVFPQFVEVSSSVHLELQLTSEEPVSCWVKTSGRSCGLALKSNTLIPMEHRLNSAGQIRFTYSCNVDSEETNSVQIFVYERLSGFRTDPASRKISARDLNSDQAVLKFRYSAGRFLSANYSLPSGVPGLGYVVTDDTTLSGHILFAPEDFTSFGTHAISAHFHNTVNISDDCCSSSHYEPVEFKVTVDKEISNHEYNLPNIALYNTSLELSAAAGEASNVFYEWITDSHIIWEICFNPGSSSQINLLPTSFDPIHINVTLANSVSSEENSKTIDIVKRVDGFSAEFDSPYIITVHFPAEEYFPMGSLNLEIYTHRRVLLSRDPFIVTPGTNSTLQLNALPTSAELFLRLKSEVSYQIITLEATVMQDTAVTVLSPYRMHGEAVVIVFNNSVGPGFLYTLDTGDGQSVSNDLRYETITSDITHSHIYSRPGEYTIYLSVSAADQEMNSSASVTVVDVGLHTDPIVTLPSGSARVSVVINSTRQTSRILACNLSFGDDSDSVKVFHLDKLQYTYIRPGTFNLSLACPFLPGKTKREQIVVKEFVPSDFEFIYNEVVMKNFSAVVVEFRIDLFGVTPVPPGVELLWNFTDGTPTHREDLTSWVKSHGFESRGNYNVMVTIKTSKSVSQTFSLPIQIGIVQFVTRRTRGMQSLDTFEFHVSKLPIPTANVSLDFGDDTSKDFLEQPVSPDSVLTVEHMYRTAGHFRPRVIVWAENFYEEVNLNSTVTVIEGGPELHMSIDPIIQYPPGAGTVLFRCPWGAQLGVITCRMDFDDGSFTDITLNISTAMSSAISHKHHFGALGQLEITANCSGSELPHQYLQTQTYVTSTCYRSDQPVFNFDNYVHKLISEQVIISARVDINCVNMTAVFSWQVNKLDSDQETTVHSVHSNMSLLTIPAQSMDEGVYVVTFYTYFKEMPSLHKTDSVTIVYEQSPLVAEIKGGSLKSLGDSREITVDAMTLSRDPDVPPETWSGLTFRWSMSSHGSLSEAMAASANGTRDLCLLCSHVSHWTSGLLVFPPGCMEINHWTLFHVVVSKDSRTSSAYQIIFVSPGSRPQIDMK